MATAIEYYYIGQYDQAKAKVEPLSKKTNEDYALNNARLGSIALAQYDFDTAEKAFFAAYEVMNSVDVNKGGRDAAAVLVQEKFKIWKGEPYERAMCNFYLGMLYYMKYDYNNARAAFENALFKLRDYGEGKHKDDKYVDVESDFVVAYIMLGKTWQRLGDDTKAQDMFRRAAHLRPNLKRLADQGRQEQSNVLLVVDFGMGPVKVTAHDNAVMAIRPYPSEQPPLPPAFVTVDGKNVTPQGMNVAPWDALVVAQDRRWQSMDTIRVVKSVAGTALMAAGAYEANRSDNRHNQAAGVAMFLAGAALKASANADLRCWEMLPRTTYLLPLKLAPGKHNITVSFGNSQLSQELQNVTAPPQGEVTYYVRMQRVSQPPIKWGE